VFCGACTGCMDWPLSTNGNRRSLAVTSGKDCARGRPFNARWISACEKSSGTGVSGLRTELAGTSVAAGGK